MTHVDQNGDDDRRAAPPADPWQETAPTTPIEHPATPFPTTVDPSVTRIDHPPARRRRTPAVVVVVVLLVVAGGLLLNPFDDDRADPVTAVPPSTAPATTAPATTTPVTAAPATYAPVTEASPSASDSSPATPGTSAEPAADEVVYVVSSTNDGDVASIEYTDQDGDIIRNQEVPLPWRLVFRPPGDQPPLVIVAQRKSGGTGPVTCTITVGGKTMDTAVQRGRYASPQCSA